jgi:hypothetical protein
MRRYLLVGLSLLTVVIAGVIYSYLSPRLALDSIRAAAKARDVDRLRELIDFDSVKSNLKDDVKARLVTSAQKDLKNNPYAGLGFLLINAMVDPMVDAIVSPAGLSALVDNGRVEGQVPGNVSRDATNPIAVLEQNYVNYSLYRIKIGQQESPADALTFTLRREGFGTWRLSRIALPETAFASLDTPGRANTDVVDPDFSIRAKVAEVILEMSQCRNDITEIYRTKSRPAPAANAWGCESKPKQSKYVRSITTDTDGVVSATIQGINQRIDGSVISLTPLIGPASPAVAPRDFGQSLYGWRCGGAGTTLGKGYLPNSCRGS